MKARIRFFIRLSVSICLILLLLKIINPSRALLLLKSINIKIFALLIILVTADRIFMAYKWRLLLKARNVDISFLRTVVTYYIGTFAGFFLPATIGGDMVRIYKLHREKEDTAKTASSVAVERILGVIASALMSILGILFLLFILKLDIWPFFWAAVIIFAVLCAGFVLSFYTHHAVGESVKRRFAGSFPAEKIAGFYRAYSGYKDKKEILIIFLILSCIEQLAAVAGNYLASLSIGLSVPFIYFMAVIPVVQLFNRVPLTFNGIGLNEGLLVYFFSILRIGRAEAFTIGIVGHTAVFLSALPAVFYVLKKRFRVKI